MKKISSLIIAIVLLISLSGCASKTDYTLNIAGLSSDIATTWLNDVAFATNSINTYSETEEHLEVYLPTDVSSTMRLNKVSVESYATEGNVVDFYANYVSPTSLSSNIYGSLPVVLTDYFTANPIETSFTFKSYSSWSTSQGYDEQTFPFAEGKERMLYTVYIPVYVKYFLMDGDLSKEVLRTYVLIPISSGLYYSVGGVMESVNTSISTLTEIQLNVVNGVLE